MNKTDMLKAAQAAEDRGGDPDTVMVTYTLNEFSAAHGEEVDTFDEDKKRINDLEYALQERDDLIALIEENIALTERLIEESRNWAESQERKDELRDLQRKYWEYKSQQEALSNELQEAIERFDSKYVR